MDHTGGIPLHAPRDGRRRFLAWTALVIAAVLFALGAVVAVSAGLARPRSIPQIVERTNPALDPVTYHNARCLVAYTRSLADAPKATQPDSSDTAPAAPSPGRVGSVVVTLVGVVVLAGVLFHRTAHRRASRAPGAHGGLMRTRQPFVPILLLPLALSGVGLAQARAATSPSELEAQVEARVVDFDRLKKAGEAVASRHAALAGSVQSRVESFVEEMNAIGADLGAVVNKAASGTDPQADQAVAAAIGRAAERGRAAAKKIEGLGAEVEAAVGELRAGLQRVRDEHATDVTQASATAKGCRETAARYQEELLKTRAFLEPYLNGEKQLTADQEIALVRLAAQSEQYKDLADLWEAQERFLRDFDAQLEDASRDYDEIRRVGVVIAEEAKTAVVRFGAVGIAQAMRLRAEEASRAFENTARIRASLSAQYQKLRGVSTTYRTVIAAMGRVPKGPAREARQVEKSILAGDILDFFRRLTPAGQAPRVPDNRAAQK